MTSLDLMALFGLLPQAKRILRLGNRGQQVSWRDAGAATSAVLSRPELASLCHGKPLNDFIPFKPLPWFSKFRLGVRSGPPIVFSTIGNLSAHSAESTRSLSR